MRHTSILITVLVAMLATTTEARSFDTHFSDSTLRIDYTVGTNRGEPTIMLDNVGKHKGWAGRRVNLTELPLEGFGRITAIDKASGDTIYRASFSTLFQEWLSTDEARVLDRSFEHVMLLPLPRAEADITLELSDKRRQPVATHTYTYSPADILVEQRAPAPLPHRVLHQGTHPHSIQIAILAEGYTPEEMDSFYVHAAEAADAILSHEPFTTYADRLTITAVASPSDDSGVSIPRLNRWLNTAVDSHFSTFYSDRYLTTQRLKRAHDLLSGIPYEHILILANTEEYGGGGVYNDYLLTAARHEYFRPVVVHEFGHSFAGLADEYFYDGDTMEDTYPLDIEPWEPNITTQVDFSSKWADMMDIPGVGLHEGGGYSFKGIWRPADLCRMRSNTYPTFCPVCQRAIERIIIFSTEPLK